VEHNVERFAKVIKPGPKAEGRLLLAPTAADDVDRAVQVLRSWPDDGTRAVLARTNRELVPVVGAAIQLSMPFRAADLVLPVESPIVDELVAEGMRLARPGEPALLAIARLPERQLLARPREQPADAAATAGDGATTNAGEDEDDPAVDRRSIAASLQGWAAPFRTVGELRAAIEQTRAALAALRTDDAPLTLATAHGTKGLEFDHVAVIGMDEGRFPSARSIADAVEPERALEEERRLAYVAWTRARRSLTLVYDPGAPSQFLREAFSAAELGLIPRAA